MIHFIKEGDIRRVGLNLYRARGGFVAVWAWYDARTYIMSFRRLRLRLHIKPWIMRSSGRFNVIHEYLMDYGLEIIPRDELIDLMAAEERRKSRDAEVAYDAPSQ